MEAVSLLLERISKAIRALSWQGKAIGVSVGVAIYPDHGLTRDALLETADEAMYKAKSAGKNTIVMAAPNADALL